MWKRMLDADILVAATLSIAVTWPVCWLLVYKFGWRYTDWLGLNDKPFGDSESFVTYLVMSNILLATLGAPILALRRILRGGSDKVMPAIGD